MFHVQENEMINSFQILKCLCCGTYNNLVPYPIYKLLYKKFNFKTLIARQYKNKNILIPVCLRCSIEFQRWKNFRSYYIRRLLEIASYMIILGGLILLYLSNLIILAFLFGVLIVSLVYYGWKDFQRLNRMEYNPVNFIQITGEDQIKFKSHKLQKFVDHEEWLREVIYERYYEKEGQGLKGYKQADFKFTTCLFCNAKVRKQDIKCFKCGQYLPLL
jgi:hypothetical protein